MNDKSEATFLNSIYTFLMRFKKEEIELSYQTKILPNASILFKIFVMFAVLCHAGIRTKNFVLSFWPIYFYDHTRETIYFILLLVSLGFEVITYFCSKLKFAKGFLYILFILLVSKDSFYIYFSKVLNTEPLYGATLVFNLVFTFVISIYWCFSWVVVLIAMIISAIFYSIYDFVFYDLVWYNKLYYSSIHFGTFLVVSLFVYSYEYYMRYTEYLTFEAKKDASNLKHFIESLPVGILITTKNLPFYINKMMIRQINLTSTPYNIVNLKLQENNAKMIKKIVAKSSLIVNENNEKQSLSDLFINKLHDKKYSMIRKNESNSEFYKVQIVELIYDNNDSEAIIMNDITDQFNLQKAKIDKEYKQKMVASFTHDMRNPLMGIIGSLEMMSSYSVDPALSEFIESALSSSRLLQVLVNDILDMHQMELNKLKINIELVDLKEEVKTCLKMFQGNFKRKGLSMILNLDSELTFLIHSDKNRIKQILMNILSNALKFTTHGYVKVRLQNIEETDQVSISIRDTGIGISKEDLPKLFQPFGKLEDKQKLNPGGIGIGLEFSQTLSRLLGGKININSKEGQGTRFIVYLARNATTNISMMTNNDCNNKKSKKEEISSVIKSSISISEYNLHSSNRLESELSFIGNGEPTHNHDIPKIKEVIPLQSCSLSNSANKKLVLIVDDDESNHYVIGQYCNKLNIGVCNAYNGEEAIKIVKNLFEKKENISLVISDISMPIMGGEQMAKKLKKLMNKQNLNNFPIVGLSGHDLNSINAFDEVILKPLSFENCVKLLKKYNVI